MLNRMLSDDDDDDKSFYDKISAFEKSRNLIIMIPGAGGNYMKVPLPYGYNAFLHAGRAGVELINGRPFGATVADLATTFVDSFNPIGGTGSLLNIVAPTVIDPFVDLVRNRNFADRPIMPDDRQFGAQTPDNQKYWGNADPISKALAKQLNDLTGGDDVVPGAIDVSPETFRYMFGFATGSAGDFFGSRLPGAIAAMVSQEARADFGLNDVPIARNVVGSKASWVDKSSFYDRRAEVEQALAYVKRYVEAGDGAKAAAYKQENDALLGMSGAAKMTTAGLSAVRKERDQIKLSQDKGQIDDARAAERRATAKAKEEILVSRFNKLWNQRVGAS
jgi:hypothetical protein